MPGILLQLDPESIVDVSQTRQLRQDTTASLKMKENYFVAEMNTAVSRKVVRKKAHVAIPKGIVGSFKFTVP